MPQVPEFAAIDTVEGKLAEVQRRDECRRRGLPLSGDHTLPVNWRDGLPGTLGGNPAPHSSVREALMRVALPMPKDRQPVYSVDDLVRDTDKLSESITNEFAFRAESLERRCELPWSYILSDNEHYSPVVRYVGQFKSPKAFMILSAPYRKAKKKAIEALMAQLEGLPPLTGRIAISAVFHEPNQTSFRDVTNYTKLVHDALTGIAYVDDKQIDESKWFRGAPDIDRPRLDISIRQLGSRR